MTQLGTHTSDTQHITNIHTHTFILPFNCLQQTTHTHSHTHLGAITQRVQHLNIFLPPPQNRSASPRMCVCLVCECVCAYHGGVRGRTLSTLAPIIAYLHTKSHHQPHTTTILIALYAHTHPSTHAPKTYAINNVCQRQVVRRKRSRVFAECLRVFPFHLRSHHHTHTHTCRDDEARPRK